MKAFVVERYGKDGLCAANISDPEVGDGDVLVKVTAAGINPLDTMVRDGEFKRLLSYQMPSGAARPESPGVTGPPTPGSQSSSGGGLIGKS